MAILDIFKRQRIVTYDIPEPDVPEPVLKATEAPSTITASATSSEDTRSVMVIGASFMNPPQDDTFKAFIPNFLYKPPFGYPLNKHVVELKSLSRNPYVYSVVKTLCDEASITKWEIRTKKEFTDAVAPDKHDKQIKDISQWFYNPNGNDESLSDLITCWIQDWSEIGAMVGVKVFNGAKEFSQLFARDAATFLKNPDIYGYMGRREEYMDPIEAAYNIARLTGPGGVAAAEQLKTYKTIYSESAAYFQYGWSSIGLPVPFGRREIMYIIPTPRSDNIYGLAPLEVLKIHLMTLVFGAGYHLDFYLNGNMPDGMVNLVGASQTQVEVFQNKLNSKFKTVDALGNNVRVGHQFPVYGGAGAQFVPFAASARDMQIIEQQKLGMKIVWMCFGVNPDEMGETENSNKSVGQSQEKVHKRKALRPLLKKIEYAINNQVMPELDPSGQLEFAFEDYDLDEDIKKHELYQLQTTIGLKTPEMIAEEEGINVQELKKQKEEGRKQRMEEAEAGQPSLAEDKPKSGIKAAPEEPAKDPLSAYFGKVEKHILSRLSADEPVKLN